jgi:hypothetical protein
LAFSCLLFQLDSFVSQSRVTFGNLSHIFTNNR